MLLEAQICDIWGVPLAGATIHHTSEGGGLQVIDPLNDSRTARLTLSLHDSASNHAKALSRILSVTYGPYLVFKGPILQPSYDFAAGTVTINAHDPTIRLKHHYHRYGDKAVDKGYPVDGKGMRILIESSNPTDAQAARNVPPNGILWGYDSTTHQGPKPDNPNDPDPGDGIWRKAERGSNVWETITNLSQSLLGPDFRFRPVDRDHPGKQGIPDDGFFCELDTDDHLGLDKSDAVYFEYGFGLDNASNVVWEPDGNLVRTSWATVFPGGERGSADIHRKYVAQAFNAMDDYGIMQGWESSGQKDSFEVIKAKAQAWVDAYKRPPDFFTVTPRIDTVQNVFDYRSDFRTGDTIRVRANRGYGDCDLIGRIISVTISAVDQAGNAQVSLECVPHIEGDVDDEGGGGIT